MLVVTERQGHLAKSNLQNLMNVWEKSQYISSWDDNECWEWLGNKNGNGYGQFKKFGQTIRLHKFSYEFFKGSVPIGLEIDHLCKNRVCLNPNHLEAVTHQENIRRSLVLLTHCPHGHEYTPENLVKSAKWKTCRICRNAHHKKYRINHRRKID